MKVPFTPPAGCISTPALYAKILREGLAICKIRGVAVVPLYPTFTNKCGGKAFQKGSFVGAKAFITDSARCLVCSAFLKGGGEAHLVGDSV